MFQKVLMFMVALALVVPALNSVEAKQRRGGGSDVVVHDRLGPVVAHRLVPPYAGKHVYVRPGR